MNFVTNFLKGNWLEKARVYAFNPRKLKQLLPALGVYLSRKGLANVRDTLLLMRTYLADIATGRYHDYDSKKLLIIVAAIVYVVTPFDLLPDLIPPGLIDDLSIVVWAMKEAGEELARYRMWREIQVRQE